MTRVASLTCLVGLSLALAPGQATAQLTKLQQRCVNTLNSGLAKITKAQGKVNTKCVKDGRKGKTTKLGPTETMEGCLSADIRFQVAKQQQRNLEKEAKKCEPPLPTFAATDAATGNSAAVEQAIALIHDIFGTDLDAAIVLHDPNDTESPQSVASRCQEKIVVQMHKCLDRRMKEFEKCKKNGLRGGKTSILYPGADDPFDDAGDLEGCIGFDRKSKIGRCAAKLVDKIDSNCDEATFGTVVPGACSQATDSFEMADCVNRLTACRSCLTLNEADDLNQDCDVFDDGAANESCPPSMCGNGTLDDNEECDDGNTANGDCCSAICEFEAPGGACGDLSDTECTNPDSCDGAGTCQDNHELPGAGCGDPSDTECTNPDSCDGAGACQDNHELSGAACGDQGVECFADDTCDGAGGCTDNGFSSPGAPCGDQGVECLIDDSCNGAGGCTDNGFSSPGAPCGDQGVECLIDDTCNGAGGCTDNGFELNGTPCGDQGVECLIDDTCNGSGSCTDNGFEPDTTSCDDSDVCTDPDECLSGNCVGGSLCGNGSLEPGCGEQCEVDGDCAANEECDAFCMCQTTALNIGMHKCVLADMDPNTPGAFCNGGDNDGQPCTTTGECFAGGGFCDPISGLLIETVIFTIAALADGAIDIDCGLVDPNTGKAVCECGLQSIDPISVPGIGFVCLSPGDPNTPCALGEIDCDGGNGLDVDLASDHNIGSCTSNADCETQCISHCAGLSKAVFDSGCEGFCEGGTNDTLPCTTDAGCPGGSCPGPDGLQHGNICGCSCIDVGGSPSPTGTLQCNLGVSIVIETGAPCDATDTLIVVGTQCIPLTTAMATASLINANDISGTPLPAGGSSSSGVAPDCNDLASSTSTGLELVGAVNFFDSTIGDLAVTLRFTCQ